LSTTQGISRDSFHKRRKTGGKLTKWRMCRKFELGRQSANSRVRESRSGGCQKPTVETEPSPSLQIGPKRIRTVRTRGGNTKYRALRVDTGNFSWASECKRHPASTQQKNSEGAKEGRGRAERQGAGPHWGGVKQ